MDSEELIDAECRVRVGTRLAGKWQIDRLLGVGGMAAVYAATHRNGRTAALKVLHEKYAAVPQIRERFLREALVANKIDHPGVVRIDDDGTTAEGVPFLVMELLDGESLEQVRLRRGGTVPTLEVMRLIERIIDVMEEAHAAGIIHRDLKPENVFLTRDGKVKVLDFGIARLMEASEGQSRTRTGLVMGTPAFMAPEQALGRWSQVDARTDLWAIGAIAFNLITGRMVHEAPSGNETLVLAASRPAPSLARHADAPLAVVRCIDRALAYDRDKRFEDAATMHGELLFVLAELTRAVSQAPAPAAPIPDLERVAAPPARPPSAAPRLEPEAPPEPPKAQRDAAGAEVLDAFDERFVGQGDAAALTEAFRQLENALFTRQQYGAKHPETARHFERAFAACEQALSKSDDSLVWRVTPYAFTLGESVVWEPRSPFDRVPYQLFADGVRLLGFVSAVLPSEIMELLRIITLDRSRDLAPDDDFVTLLWDAGFEHIVYQAIDTFAEGEQTSRAAFERATAEITALARFDAGFQLEECWNEARGGVVKETTEARQRRLRHLLSLSETRDREALAQADQFHMRDLGAESAMAQAVDVEPAALEVLRARLCDSARLDERFVGVLAEAYAAGVKLGAAGAITVPLRAALDGLSQTSLGGAVRLVSAIMAAFEDRDAPGQARALRGSLARAVISERALTALLAEATSPDASAAVVALVSEVLSVAGDAFVPPVLELVVQGGASALGDAAFEYLARNAEGHEEELAAALPRVGLDTGLALVRILARLGTAAAQQAVLRAAESPHALLRIEALSHADAGSERLRLELRTLIEDPTPEVRSAALRTISERHIRAAGPYLVMRVKHAGFDKLPLEERRQVLYTLAALAPARAEEICIELLGDARLLTLGPHEESRALAAELLGQLASSRESLAALEEAATSRFRYSERVRSSAVFAREQAVVRLSGQPPPPSGAARSVSAQGAGPPRRSDSPGQDVDPARRRRS